MLFSKRLTIVTIVQPRYKVVDEKDMSPEFQKNTFWGMQIFLEWCEERSIEMPVIDMRYL